MAATRFHVTASTFRLPPRGVVGSAAAVVLLALVLVGAIPASARATGVPPDGGAKEVSFFFRSPTNRGNVLQLQLFPAQGVAAVDTYEDLGGEPRRGVAYAIAIPAAPFDGSLDLDFPGLGEVVGTVTPSGSREPAVRAKLCEGSYPGENATFKGRLVFRGAGGSGRWQTNEAQAGVLLACGAEPEKENGAAALFGHVAELGPVLSGPAPIRFFAHGEVRHRVIEFIAFAGHSSNRVEFVAIDREWLPGEVATERWVKKAPASLEKTVALRAAPRLASATFSPPAPFFGKGTYRRRTGKLTGSLGVSFLGLKLHLTPSSDHGDPDRRRFRLEARIAEMAIGDDFEGRRPPRRIRSWSDGSRGLRIL